MYWALVSATLLRWQLELNYTKQDAPHEGERYDLVLDAVGKSKSSKLKDLCQKALTPEGKYVSVDDGSPKNSIEELSYLNELVEAGKLKAVIDRSYPLEEIFEAHRYVNQGHKKGNVVINVVLDDSITPAATERSAETAVAPDG